MCCDIRKSVRQTAITYLQRALLAHELQNLTSSEWESCFLQVELSVQILFVYDYYMHGIKAWSVCECVCECKCVCVCVVCVCVCVCGVCVCVCGVCAVVGLLSYAVSSLGSFANCRPF